MTIGKRNRILDWNPVQCLFVHHRSRMSWPWIEPCPPPFEAGNWLPEVWQDHLSGRFMPLTWSNICYFSDFLILDRFWKKKKKKNLTERQCRFGVPLLINFQTVFAISAGTIRNSPITYFSKYLISDITAWLALVWLDFINLIFSWRLYVSSVRKSQTGKLRECWSHCVCCVFILCESRSRRKVTWMLNTFCLLCNQLCQSSSTVFGFRPEWHL